MGDFSYDELFDVVRRERSRDELQDISPDFYSQVNLYIDSLKMQISASDPLKVSNSKIATQLRNTQKLQKELLERREKKILALAFNKVRTGSSIIDTSKLLPCEISLFEGIVNELIKSRNNILSDKTIDLNNKIVGASDKNVVPENKPASTVSEDQTKNVSDNNMVKVEVLSDLPKFMGSSRQVYGPFKKSQVVLLPEKIVAVLVRKGRVKRL